MNSAREQALRLAKDLYPNHPINELIDAATQLEVFLSGKSSPSSGVPNIVDFVSSLKIHHPITGETPINLYQYQRDMLNVFVDCNRSIVLSSRQMGKTTIASLFCLWEAITKPNQTIGVASYKFVTALEMLDRIKLNLHGWPTTYPAIKSIFKTEIQFQNGSTIKIIPIDASSDPASFTTLVIDEAAYISNKFLSSIITKYEDLETKPKLILMSTPNEAKGAFYDAWMSGSWHRMKLGWWAYPNHDLIWYNEMQERLDDVSFRREILCEFVDAK